MKSNSPKLRLTASLVFSVFITILCFLLPACTTAPPDFEAERVLSDKFLADYLADENQLLSDSVGRELDTLIEKLSTCQPYSDKYLIQAIFVKANNLSNLADYKTSNTLSFEILSDFEKVLKSDTSFSALHAGVHSLIGYNFDKLLLYEKAINHYEKARLIFEESGMLADVASQYSNECMSFAGAGNNKKAIKACDMGKAVLDAIPNPDANIMMLKIHNQMARANALNVQGQKYRGSGQTDSMKISMNESILAFHDVIDFFKKNQPASPYQYLFYGGLVNNYTLLGVDDPASVDSAIYYLDKIIPAYSQPNAQVPQPELLGYFQSMLASNLFKKEDYDRAFAEIEKALNSMDYYKYKKSPNAELMLTQHPNRLYLSIVLGFKGVLQFKYYQKKGNLIYLEKSREILAEAIAVLESYALDFSSERALIDHRARVENIFTSYMLVNLESYRISGETAYFEEALTITEQYKNFVLRQGLNRQISSFTAGAEREKIVRQELALANERRALVQQIQADPANASEAIDLLLALQNKETLFLNGLKNSSSELERNYYFDRYDQSVPDLETIRGNFLDPNTALIEYHFNGDEPVAFVITSSSFDYVTLKRDDEFYAHLDELTKESLPNEGMERYKVNAHEIYNSIFKEIEALLPPEVTQLIIVPDNALRELPFDLLLPKIPAEDVVIKDYPYLVKKYAIGYVYSIGAYYLAEQLRKSKPGKPVLNFIGFNASPQDINAQEPEYNEGCSTSSLEYLTGVTAAVAKLFPSARQKVFREATKEDFIKNAEQADILYMAMHGCVSDRAPLDYGLQFLGKGDNLLTVNEILDLSLNARLTVLGSCNTEKGQLSAGEGIASIARAFRRAGCLNLIASQTKVNDMFGAMIYEQYLNNWIEKGDNSIVALAKAKRSFLNNDSLKSGDIAPQKWAGIMAIGKPIFWKD